MKPWRVVTILVVASLCGLFCASSFAEDTVAQQLAILDEKLNRMKADVEALQFNQDKMQKQITELQAQVLKLRESGTSASASDLQALEARIKAVDAAREKDKQVILDQLAKELANLSASRVGTAPPPKPTGGAATDHVVQKGETLTAIAKQYGVSVVDLKKANSLTSDEIKVGQKLTIPK
jgi:LysM repeat protein